MSRRSGFTLVELLVVISIVALLSSIVMASVSAAREKGRIAAALRFTASLGNSLGSEAVGIWTFEEGTGATTTEDLSGFGNRGVLKNNPAWSTDTYHYQSNYSISFNGASQYVEVAPHPSLNVRTAGTISLWAMPTILDGALRDVLVKGGASWVVNDYSVIFHANRFKGNIANGTVALTTNGPSTGVVEANRWYHVVFTWDTVKGKAEIYLDGAKVDSKSTSIVPRDAETGLTIGRDNQYGGYYFGGSIDDVRIYGTSLSLAQVERLYAEGAPLHVAAFVGR